MGILLALGVRLNCETWSIARWVEVPDGGRKPPRPLRTAECAWGLLDVSNREHAQLDVGNRLMLFTLQAATMQSLTGGFSWTEYPEDPHRQRTRHMAAPSIWNTSIMSWLKQTHLFIWLHVLQGFFGAHSPKPTSLMLSGIKLNDAVACEQSLRLPQCAQGTNIGRGQDGWKTSHLKEYPPLFCKLGA